MDTTLNENLRPAFALAAGAVTALGASALTYAYSVEPHTLDVKHIPLALPRLAPQFDGFRLAHFSDLHMETWRNWDLLAEVIERINDWQADVVAFTGDFVDRDPHPVMESLPAALRRLAPREAVLAVLGNHDHWCKSDAVRDLLRRGGMIDLNNAVHTVRRDGAALHLAGVDSFVKARARLDVALDGIPDDGAAILLAHEPDFALVSAPTRRFDLQLSGHSHGGQVRLPLLMQMVLPKGGRRFVAGLYELDGMALYVNRGLAMSGLPLRFNCPPELTFFTLHAPR